MTADTSKCNCELASCKDDCNYNHTHKEFWCEKCHPERYIGIDYAKKGKDCTVETVIYEPEENASENKP